MLVGVESRELASLLSLISHEMRSPLGVVRGYLRMLTRAGGDRSDRHEQFITAALKASERAAEILAQLSTLAQLHGAEPPYDFKQVSLQGVVAGAASTIVLPRDPVVQLRVGHVEAVIRAQGREATIEISARREQRDGENGIMIHMMSNDAPDTPSSTVPLNLSRGGLGLELPIAATIIDAHCGQVREPQYASGYSGVTVWLPLETPRPETTPR
jgi:signal transduction histidine kinase